MMRISTVLLAIIALVGLINPLSASAQTALISSPLPTASKLVCSCTNLRSVDMDVKFTINGNSYDFTILPGLTQQYVHHYSLNPDTVASANCMISRLDGKAALTKHLACTLSSIDQYLNINAVVPVDKKHTLPK